MNLQDILYNEVSQLSDELRDIDEQMRRAARQDDTGSLAKLAQRKRELPELIRQAQVEELSDRINEQRTRLGVFEMDLKKARELSQTLVSELTPKITALNQEIERLRFEAQQALANSESLQYSVSHETAEFNRLNKQREKLLLSQYDSFETS